MNPKAYYTAIALFVGCAIVLSVYIFPSGEDIAWMLFYDRQFDRSSREFYEFFRQKEQTRQAVVPKVLLDLEFANTDEAIRTVEAYVRENPEDLEARLYLGDLYKRVSRPYAYLRNLEQIYELAPTVSRLQELKNLYEDLNESEDRIYALEQLIQEKEATVEDFRDLAELYAARGELDLALETVETMLTRFSADKIDDVTANFAVNIFLATDQQLEAFLFASNYATEHPQDVETIISMSYKMIDAGLLSEARFLSELVPESKRGNPKYLELLLTLLIEQEDEKGIYVILEQEYRKGHLLPSFYSRLLILAILEKNDELAVDMLQSLDMKEVPQNRLTVLIDNLITYRKQELAKLLKDNLGEDYLEQNRLIRLGVAIAEKGAAEQVEALIEQEGYDEVAQLQIAQFLYSSGYKDVARNILNRIDSMNEADTESLENIVELYINLDMVDDIDKLLSDYTLKPGFPGAPLITAQFMVLAAQGKIDELERRIALREKIPIQTYVDLFFIAEKTKQRQTAMRLAERINQLASTSYSKMIMARALALNGQSAEALKIIRSLRRQGVDVRDSYFYTLILALDQDELYDQELEDFLVRVSSDPLVPETKLREYGFFLIDKGYKEKAEIPFKVVAKDKPYQNTDLQTLLALWGPTPTSDQIEWMVEESRDAQGKDLAGWIEYFTFLKRPDIGTGLAEANGWQEDPDAGLAYFEALQEAKERQKMKDALAIIVGNETDLRRLRKIAQMSYDLALFPTAEIAIQKILDQEPEDPAALRLLGFVKYVRAEFHQAIGYLRRYLQTPEPDYLGWYFYSDIYWFFRHWDWSRKYLRQALYLLDKKKDRDPYSELIEAQALYRMGCFTKSLTLYEELLEKYPKNVGMKIDYANLLMVLDKFCRANYIMAITDPFEDPDLDPELQEKEQINLLLTKTLYYENMNQLQRAWRLVCRMQQIWPKNAKIMQMRASIEQTLGRWWNAVLWYEEGLRLEPWNEELQNLQRKIFCEKASFISLLREYKLTGKFQVERISELEWSHRYNQEYVGKLKVESDTLVLPDALGAFDGINFDFKGTRARGEVTIERNLQDGLKLELSGFLSREGLGAGLFYERPDWWGLWSARLWYHKLTWEFTQTIIDYGVEDRVEVFRSLKYGPFLEIFGRGGYRWYHLRTFGEAAQTWTLLAGLNYRFRRLSLVRRALGDEAAVFFNYYIDSQYVTKEKRIFSPTLQTEITPLDIVSRETHVWQLSFNKVFCPTFWIEGFGGASWDRIARGDVGPIAGFVTHFGSQCGPQLNLSWLHTFSSQFENESVDRFIADFKIPY